MFYFNAHDPFTILRIFSSVPGTLLLNFCFVIDESLACKADASEKIELRVLFHNKLALSKRPAFLSLSLPP